MNTIAAKYPNRKKRKEVLADYHRSVRIKHKHGHINPGKTLFLMEAARYLGTTRKALRYWEYKGWIRPCFVTVQGRRRRVYRKEILDQIKEVRDAAIAEKQKSDSD